MKKIIMKMEFKNKNKYTLFFTKRKAVYIWRHTMTVRENGVFWVKTSDGKQMLYTTNQDGEIRVELNSENKGVPIRFADENLNDTWTKVYGFIFDDESGMLFYGERETSDLVGIHYSFAYSSYDVYMMKREALQVAALIDEKLPEIITVLENSNKMLVDAEYSLSFD